MKSRPPPRRDRPADGRGARGAPGQGSEAPDWVLVAGPHAVLALASSAPERIIEILVARESLTQRAEALSRLRAVGLKPNESTRAELDRLAGLLRHQGLLARARPADYVDWESLLERPDALLVAVDQITDPHNFGAILRSTEAMGGTGALVTRDRCAQLGATTTRTSAGASEILPVAIETNLSRALLAARDAGLSIIGADLDGVAPEALDLSGPLVLVIGAEGDGLRRLTRESCTAIVTIPLLGRTESLNASAAAAVLLAEVARQRRAKNIAIA